MTNKLSHFTKASLLALPLMVATETALATNLVNIWQQAQQQDLQLQMAQADIELQSEKHQQARAAMLPSAAVNATLSHVDNSAIGLENFGQSYSLDIKQGIYHRDVMLQAQQVDMLVENSELGYAWAHQQLQMRAAAAYFDQLSAQDNLMQIQQAKSAMSKRLNEIKARYEVGMSNQVMVQEAQARLDLMQAQLVAAQGQLTNSQQLLAQITNQPVARVTPLQATASNSELSFLPHHSLETWQQQAQINSLPLQQLNKQLQLAKLDIQTQEAVLTPGVDLIAQYSYTDNSVQAYAPNADQFMVGIKVSMPLYTGGYVESKINQASLQYRQVQRQLEQSRRALNTEVHTSFVNVTSATQLVHAQEQVKQSAQLAFAAMESAVEVGSRTRIDLVDAERQFYSSIQQLNEAKYQLILAQLKLRLVSGSLSVEDLHTVNALLQG
jgi:outer membrane protein